MAACLSFVLAPLSAAQQELSFELRELALVGRFDNFREPMPLAELKSYLDKIQGPLPRSVNYNDLLNISDQLTAFMRQRGYKFHYAHLAEQGVSDGAVSINIRTINLSDVQLDNQSPVSDKLVLNKFKRFIGEPVYQPDIDKVLTQLRNAEEIKAFAYYSRGSQRDSVRLNIKLSEVSGLRASAKLDNYGSPETGKERLTLEGRWLSPTGRLDRLSAAVLASKGDDKTNSYGYLQYSSPLSNPALRINLSASNNVFGVGNEFASLELNGDASVYSVSFSQDFAKTWRGGQQWSLNLQQKETDFESIVDDPSIEQDERAQSFGLRWQLQRQGDRAQHFIFIGHSRGQFSIDGYIDDQAYDKTGFAYYLGWSWPNEARHRLYSSFRWSLRGQYSQKRVSSFDQIALGGAWGARSVQAGSFAADRGLVNSLEWHLPYMISGVDGANAHWWRLSPFVFFDYASGDKLDLDGNTIDSASLNSLGLGLITALGNKLNLKLQAGHNQQQRLDSGQLVEGAGLLAELEYRWP
ncbi:ShlB/FhaC/HecB family hemolysin secretion/activation protein [Agaribacterium haliotis]|uniref:ShlB/FhaC/HecB family hemolysin secretion/activation protein n=1 Tax=Agaribacterium haliotis TaxID=2013869 RepID=UPI000BB58E54|nr:ShlB/FhaC/HecB family hemolysin secretion/activation protein [Agaribacterium haliotis]